MVETTFSGEPTRVIISAIVGIVCLLVLIIKFKLHPVISMMLSAVIIGIGAGMPLSTITDTEKPCKELHYLLVLVLCLAVY